MAIIEEDCVTIKYLNKKGFGVASTQKGGVELANTLPGEIVEFTRHSYRGKSHCTVNKIQKRSLNRQIPICEYFSFCGGCSLQHLGEQEYKEFKKELVLPILRGLGYDCETDYVSIPPTSRRRINFDYIIKNNNTFLGLNKYNSNQIINIEKCYTILPELSKLIAPLREFLPKILDNQQRGKIYLVAAETGIDMLIELHHKKIFNSKQAALISSFAEKHNIIRVSTKHNYTNTCIYIKQKPYIPLGDKIVNIEPDSFLQPSYLSDKILSEKVIEYLQPSKAQLGVDLFCGRGTYTIPLSRICTIQGVEIDKNAIKALVTATENNIDIKARNLFTNPLTTEELNKYHILVINPPRSGAVEQCRNIAKSNLKKVCYVSCNVSSFESDSEILLKHGYKIKKVTILDQFYWTAHVELVVLFEKE